MSGSIFEDSIKCAKTRYLLLMKLQFYSYIEKVVHRAYIVSGLNNVYSISVRLQDFSLETFNSSLVAFHDMVGKS